MNHGATIADSGMLEIKNIPTGLILYAVQQWLPCQRYATGGGMPKNTNHFIKAISVWLILKSETTSGNVHGYRKQLPVLATKCKMSVRTLEKYINWMRKEKLATVTEKNLQLESYKALRRFDIDIKEREQTIYYDTTNETDLAEILIALALMKFKERWLRMYWKKMKQNPDKYKHLYDLLIKNGADPSRLQEPEYFRECHLELLKLSFEQETPGHSSTFHFLHNECNANPDINATASTYAFKMGYNHAMSFCHLKYRLERKGLVSFYERVIEGMQRAHKDDGLFHVRWLKEARHTIWFMCDRIEVLATNFLTKKAAA